MISAEFLDQLSKFSLIIQKKVTSNYAGSRASLAQGYGQVFEDHQPYVPGEDFRRIDWKVYARTDKLHIRRFEEERSLIINILTDVSNSMRFYDKWDYAAMISAGLAFLSMKENEKFQFSTFADRISPYKPRKGRQHLANMIDILNNMKLTGQTRFLEIIQRFKKTITSRSLIFIVSDFLFDLEELESSLDYLEKNEIHLIQVLDKRELNLDFSGQYKLKDSEDDSTLTTYISPMLRKEYKERIGKHINKIQEICDTLGAKYTLITTDMPIFDAFFNILKK